MSFSFLCGRFVTEFTFRGADITCWATDSSQAAKPHPLRALKQFYCPYVRASLINTQLQLGGTDPQEM